MGQERDVTQHILVPPHELLRQEEAEESLGALGIRKEQLPKIFSHDPAIAHLGATAGDVIRIKRRSQTAGVSYVYRTVIEGVLG